MALVLDTGPLVALLDRSDVVHIQCRRLIESSNEALVIPAPVLVEVEQLASTRMPDLAFATLLRDILAGDYIIESLQFQDYARVAEIWGQYRDTPVGFVDAAVLAIVERLNETKVATLDHRHFRMLRPRHVDSLRLLPE